MKTIITHALIINEGRSFTGSVLIDGCFIKSIYEGVYNDADIPCDVDKVIDVGGRWLLPGAIDDQVHFREPGLTHKGDIASESLAAIAGGVTSFMDMPNTQPQTTTLEAWEWKFARAAETSVANYTFFFGATNDNIESVRSLRGSPARRYLPGVKMFLGSSTGNMLVDRKEAIRDFFKLPGLLIAVHAEDEDIIRRNREKFVSLYGADNLDISFHSKIRDAEACFSSSSAAVKLARELGTRLHIFHLSTARELSLLDRGPLLDRRITGEVCIHHLWFSDADYQRFGNRIKWNPAIKTAADRDALRQAVADGVISVVATDHAPHLLSEKEGTCLKAASGGPMVQHSLLAMLELAAKGFFSREKVVEMMAHNPATLFRIDRRGFVRNGYYADLVVVDPNKPQKVAPENILYKCGWSPLEDYTFSTSIYKTFVNGFEVFAAGRIPDGNHGMRLEFRG
ncbi:MAG: dihydroorotase [Tannerella sp.]|jgi:dihydroorotase|nr:dihydroorotase [Tannerella sp.]